MNKTCFRCGVNQPVENFYKHPKTADGYLGKCKECTKRDVKLRYQSPEGRKRIKAYEKKRFQTPERKAKLLLYQRKSRASYPIKNAARVAVGNAVRDGRLTRMPCEVCGDPNSQAHHHDYRKPLSVQWFCFKHHREIGHHQIVSD